MFAKLKDKDTAYLNRLFWAFAGGALMLEFFNLAVAIISVTGDNLIVVVRLCVLSLLVATIYLYEQWEKSNEQRDESEIPNTQLSMVYILGAQLFLSSFTASYTLGRAAAGGLF